MGKPTISQTRCYSLGMPELRRAGLKPGTAGELAWEWADGFAAAIVFDATDPERGFMELAHLTRPTDGQPKPIRYRLLLMATIPPLGGHRLWFACPRTGRRSGRLFLPAGGERFLCRWGYRLVYPSEREGDRDRLLRKARRLHRKIGGDGEALGRELPPRRFHAWGRKYWEGVAKWEAAERAAMGFLRVPKIAEAVEPGAGARKPGEPEPRD